MPPKDYFEILCVSVPLMLSEIQQKMWKEEFSKKRIFVTYFHKKSYQQGLHSCITKLKKSVFLTNPGHL